LWLGTEAKISPRRALIAVLARREVRLRAWGTA
jgi:hypothetical protein